MIIENIEEIEFKIKNRTIYNLIKKMLLDKGFKIEEINTYKQAIKVFK